MNTLKLTLKKEWFDMIKSGEKKHEYREIKPYWETRLMHYDIVKGQNNQALKVYNLFKKIHAIQFTNGYSPTSPQKTLLCKGIRVGIGKPEWGAPNYPVFIIELGEHALTLKDIQEQQLQITCADESKFTTVKNTLLNAGLTSWLFEAGRQVIQVFKDGDFMGDKELDDNFGAVISAEEFLKRFVYSK